MSESSDSLLLKFRQVILFAMTLTLGLGAGDLFAEERDSDELAAFGLSSLEVLPKSQANQVRGTYLETRHYGISFISGMLFDPDTASFIKGHSIQLTEAADYVSDSQLISPFARSNVNWDREATLQVSTQIVDLESAMRGVVQATGFALSNY